MATPDRAKPIPSATGTLRPAQEFGFEADFADLAARFAAKSGGGLSPELSAELALEIVLNEIVEQACQITGATGAAIILDRDGELLCRASSGSTAPELGLRIDRSAGLAGECIRARKTLWCDDTFTDPRAEADASKRLGIRSIVIMPLLRGDTLLGIFDLFSTEPYAFGVRDERALEVLADRTATNLEHANQPFEAQTEPIGAAADLQEEHLQKIGLQDVSLHGIPLHTIGASNSGTKKADSAQLASPNSTPLKADPKDRISDVTKADAEAVSSIDAEFEPDFPDFDPEEITPDELHALLKNAGVVAPEPDVRVKDVGPVNVKDLEPGKTEATTFAITPVPVAKAPAPPKPVDYVNWAIGFAIVSVAVMLGLVLGQHFVLSHLPARAAATQVAVPSRSTPNPNQPASSTVVNPPNQKPELNAKASEPARTSTAHEARAASDEAVPPGGLLVSENGKEVFRLPPGQTQADASAEQVIQPASDVDSDPTHEPVVDIPESQAQRELLYRIEPEYPDSAREQNIQGAVVLELHIGRNGSVENVDVVSGPTVLAQASKDAVKQWKFKPHVVNGRAAEMQTRVTFNFKLPE